MQESTQYHLEKPLSRHYLKKIEDEYDNTVCEKALKEYEARGRKSRPIEELWQELGI